MKNRMGKDELIKLIANLKLCKDEYWILSSSALVIRGIYPDAGDLDIAVTETGLEELKRNYNVKQKENGWYFVSDKIECVVDQKESWKIEEVEGYNLESIEKYYRYLKDSSREKDRKRIPIIEDYMRSRKK